MLFLSNVWAAVEQSRRKNEIDKNTDVRTCAREGWIVLSGFARAACCYVGLPVAYEIDERDEQALVAHSEEKLRALGVDPATLDR